MSTDPDCIYNKDCGSNKKMLWDGPATCQRPPTLLSLHEVYNGWWAVEANIATITLIIVLTHLLFFIRHTSYVNVPQVSFFGVKEMHDMTGAIVRSQ